MKKLRTSLAAKTGAVILLTLCLLIMAYSGAGIAYLVYENAYSDGGTLASADPLQQLLQSKTEDVLDSYVRLAMEDAQSKAAGVAELLQEYDTEDSNFFFSILDDQGKVLLTTDTGEKRQMTAVQEYTYVRSSTRQSLERTFSSEEQMYSYLDGFGAGEKNIEIDGYDYNIEDSDTPYKLTIQYSILNTETLQATGCLRTPLTQTDQYASLAAFLQALVSLRYALIFILIAALVGTVVLLAFLLPAAGHKAGVEGICCSWFDRIPFDLCLCLLGLCAFGVCTVLLSVLSGMTMVPEMLLTSVPLVAVLFLLVLAAVLTGATRLKAGKWWRNTILFRLLRLLWHAVIWLYRGISYVVRRLPLIWKTVLTIAVLSLIELLVIAACADRGEIAFWWLLEKLLLVPAAVMLAINLRTLQQGGEKLAAGDVHYQVPTRHMLPVFRRYAEALNSISDGMQKAVAEQTRSERMKAELITNVSHDIKTPLTSIVTYVDLLKKKGAADEQAAEYLEVLNRQSARLKKLTEDLVEASKAATGSLQVELTQTDLNVLLDQAAGEYAEKLEAQGLTPVCDFCPESPVILADGKLLWRVFDNLLSNICKYALSGTRVYLSSCVKDGTASVTFRNISREPLNISSDELTERFVRGDRSRNTEGSGLGLSIAKNLTELQKGTFALAIDGDLFKATVTFPLSD